MEAKRKKKKIFFSTKLLYDIAMINSFSFSCVHQIFNHIFNVSWNVFKDDITLNRQFHVLFLSSISFCRCDSIIPKPGVDIFDCVHTHPKKKKMFHIALRRPNCISSQLQAWMAWEWARRVEKKNEIEIEGVLCLCDQLSYLEFVFEWIDSNRLGIFVMLQILSRSIYILFIYIWFELCVKCLPIWML